MLKLTNKEAPGKRLVLGFDSGCLTCLELAKRVKRQVGDKLEVVNLRNPRVQEWRERALGEDASWVPTLFEVEGSKIRAWTGWWLGVNLSRFLGPVATWRVVRVLGEAGEVLEAEHLPAGGAVTGLTRGQFLKGIGGAAIAVSMLSSDVLFPSVAEARTKSHKSPLKNGTSEQRRLAETIVQDSKQFKSLAKRQAHIGASFDFEHAITKVARKSSNLAFVGVGSGHPERGIIALFSVDLKRKNVFFYRHQEFFPNGEGSVRVDSYNDGRPASRYSRLTVYKKYVVTEDGRKLTHRQFRKEAKSRSESKQSTMVQHSVTAAQYSGDACSSCEQQAGINCEITSGLECAIVGLLIGGAAGLPFGPGGAAIVGGVAGVLGGVACGVFASETNGCDSFVQSECFEVCNPQ